MRYVRIVIPGFFLIGLLGSSIVTAGSLEPADHLHEESVKAVHEAAHDVDHAWEVYHRAALGGTLASPASQAEIEEHLHEARNLIAQAHEAARREDHTQVERLVNQIRDHTTLAIEASKEQKK